MTLEQLNTLLKATGYPVAYSHFKADVEAPYIIYLEDSTVNFFADNKVYVGMRAINIELYTDKKDLSAEKKLEDLLNENELPYGTYEEWIESEKLFQKIYEVVI